MVLTRLRDWETSRQGQIRPRLSRPGSQGFTSFSRQTNPSVIFYLFIYLFFLGEGGLLVVEQTSSGIEDYIQGAN